MGIPLSSFLCPFSHAASKQQCCPPGCENNFDGAKASEVVPKLPITRQGKKLKIYSSSSRLNKDILELALWSHQCNRLSDQYMVRRVSVFCCFSPVLLSLSYIYEWIDLPMFLQLFDMQVVTPGDCEISFKPFLEHQITVMLRIIQETCILLKFTKASACLV